MEYCAVDGEKLAAVQNAKMQEPIALRGVWGFGRLVVLGLYALLTLCLLCVRGLVGACKSIESRCVGACSGVGNAWAVVGLAKILQNLCKNR